MVVLEQPRLASVMEKTLRDHLENCHVVGRPGHVWSYLFASLELELEEVEVVMAMLDVVVAVVRLELNV